MKADSHLMKRRVNESLLIQRTPNSINLDKGVQLGDIWYPSLKYLCIYFSRLFNLTLFPSVHLTQHFLENWSWRRPLLIPHCVCVLHAFCWLSGWPQNVVKICWIVSNAASQKLSPIFNITYHIHFVHQWWQYNVRIYLSTTNYFTKEKYEVRDHI